MDKPSLVEIAKELTLAGLEYTGDQEDVADVFERVFQRVLRCYREEAKLEESESAADEPKMSAGPDDDSPSWIDESLKDSTMAPPVPSEAASEG